jgi:hypothetical protein
LKHRNLTCRRGNREGGRGISEILGIRLNKMWNLLIVKMKRSFKISKKLTMKYINSSSK